MSSTMPLLQTKLYLPAIRPEQVPRARLTQGLDEAFLSPLTLISAPAGFGKTTLIAEWMAAWRGRAREESPNLALCSPHFGWLSLDGSDNDPVRFWSYVATALDQAAGGVGAPVLQALQATPPQPLEAVLTLLINGLAHTEREIVLALDDYQLIEAQPVHDSLHFLLEHQPPTFHLILLTRSDPPLPLARWRARGRLLELRAAELRFSGQETAELLHQISGLPLTNDQIAILETRTEGWAAGLQLAALSLKGVSDVAGLIQTFTGNNRYVLDYLVDEVLQRQPAATQTFLLQTAVLDRLHPALCDQLTGRTDSYALLQQLQRENLFLVALDEARTWWRYHGLFAGVLRSRLLEADPAAVCPLQYAPYTAAPPSGLPSTICCPKRCTMPWPALNLTWLPIGSNNTPML
jgi:LuxR family transcriptional regulator, maltose regulon positive regulatory protein